MGQDSKPKIRLPYGMSAELFIEIVGKMKCDGYGVLADGVHEWIEHNMLPLLETHYEIDECWNDLPPTGGK